MHCPLLTSPWLHNRRLCMRCMGNRLPPTHIAFGDVRVMHQSPLSFAKQNKVYYPFFATPYNAKGDVKIEASPQSKSYGDRLTPKQKIRAMHLKQSFKSIAFGYIKKAMHCQTSPKAMLGNRLPPSGVMHQS